MFEIELKAWAHDLQAVIATTESFATYIETIDKQDRYFRQPRPDGTHMTVRIRDEAITRPDLAGTALTSRRTTITHKNKVSRVTTDGVPYEVNEEHEFTVSDAAEFELLLLSSCFSPSHQKHKIARGYESGRYHIELCTIEGLGDFIEIETMSNSDDDAVVSMIQKELEDLIERCGGSRNDIEKRWYSQLLAEKSETAVE